MHHCLSGFLHVAGDGCFCAAPYLLQRHLLASGVWRIKAGKGGYDVNSDHVFCVDFSNGGIFVLSSGQFGITTFYMGLRSIIGICSGTCDFRHTFISAIFSYTM